MAETFTHVGAIGFTKNSKPKVNTASFGDGYSQRIAAGINNQEDYWDISFVNRTLDHSAEIIDFFERHGGVTYFLWTPPGEVTEYKIVCQEWSVEYTSPISRTITSKFDRVYDLD